jgi:hypothetical protein
VLKMLENVVKAYIHRLTVPLIQLVPIVVGGVKDLTKLWVTELCMELSCVTVEKEIFSHMDSPESLYGMHQWQNKSY